MKILVTGGSRGIGRRTALTLTEEGHEVHTFSRGEVSEDLEHPLSDKITHFSGIDIDCLEDLAKLDFSLYDGLVNNAGISCDGFLTKQNLDDICDVINTNLTSLILVTQMYIKARMKMGGNIVNISSIVSKRGYKGLGVYSATKSGINGFTKSLANEMGRKRFKVNAVMPGYVDTKLIEGISDKQREAIIASTPLGRMATTQDIADTVSFLFSDKSKFITGQLIAVDGGMTI